MDLRYSIQDKYEGEENEYQTWKWIEGHEEDPFKNWLGYWQKQSVPPFTSSENKKALAWYNISNAEDLIFLEKEKTKFDNIYENEKKEILKGIEDNKKLSIML